MHEMEEDAWTSFSKLFALLHSAYEATNMTCQVLVSSCNNHQNMLKRWSLPAKEEISECTCKPYSEEPQEMEKDIANAVERAKATRKGIMNVSDVNKRYAMKTMHDKSSEYSSSSQRQKGNLYNTENDKKTDCQKVGVKDKNYVPAKHKVRNAIESHSRKSSVKTKISSCLQTTYQRDYSARNSYLACKTGKLCSTDSTRDNIVQIATTKQYATKYTIDVDSLLKNVSANNIEKYTKINLFQNIVVDKTCSVHGERTSAIAPMYVDLKEAMCTLGVSSELLKLLRSYHQYIQTENTLGVSDQKQIAKDLFLHQLDKSNENGWSTVSSEPVINMYLHHLLVFVQIFSWNKSGAREGKHTELEQMISFLNRNYRNIVDTDATSDSKSNIRKKEDTSPENIVEKSHYAFAGIWNRKCWNIFSDFNSTLKISYNKEEDCRSLQKNFQKIQALHLQVEILETMKTDLFPFLMNLPDDHMCLPQLYKSCSALCDISSLSVPVLLKF